MYQMGDKQQCGKRAREVAAALKAAKPDSRRIELEFSLPHEIVANTTWASCVLEVMRVFAKTNHLFPKGYFLTLCGMNPDQICLTKDI
jgi:hypothetical protein